MLLPMITNVFEIPERIKATDERLSTFFNTNTQKYEIHCTHDGETSLMLTLPFDELDCRSIDYLIERQSMSVHRFVEEMDKQNERIKKSELDRRMLEASDNTRDIVKYVNTHESKEWIDNEAFKTRWV